MKSTKTYIYILLTVFFGLAVTGCLFDTDPRELTKGPFAAFKFQGEQVNSAADTLQPYNIALEVQILRPVAGKLDEALSVNYIVVDSLTTATSPDDYTFVTPSPVTVPADCLRTNLIIEVDGRSIPEGEARVLTIQLTGNESRGVKGAEEIGQFELIIVGQ